MPLLIKYPKMAALKRGLYYLVSGEVLQITNPSQASTVKMLFRQFREDSEGDSGDGSDESPASNIKRDLVIYNRYKHLDAKTLTKLLV
jgi:hypothetical protein